MVLASGDSGQQHHGGQQLLHGPEYEPLAGFEPADTPRLEDGGLFQFGHRGFAGDPGFEPGLPSTKNSWAAVTLVSKVPPTGLEPA